MAENTLDAHASPAAVSPASARRRAGRAPYALLRHAGGSLLPWLLPVSLLVLWQLGASQGWISEQVLPSPHFVWLTLQDLYLSLIHI